MGKKLQSYDLKVEHRLETKHTNADSLSQLLIIAFNSAKQEHLFNLIAQPSKWKEESEKSQRLLERWSKDATVIDS